MNFNKYIGLDDLTDLNALADNFLMEAESLFNNDTYNPTIFKLCTETFGLQSVLSEVSNSEDFDEEALHQMLFTHVLHQICAILDTFSKDFVEGKFNKLIAEHKKYKSLLYSIEKRVKEQKKLADK